MECRWNRADITRTAGLAGHTGGKGLGLGDHIQMCLAALGFKKFRESCTQKMECKGGKPELTAAGFIQIGWQARNWGNGLTRWLLLPTGIWDCGWSFGFQV